MIEMNSKAKINIGQKFGKLTVIGLDNERITKEKIAKRYKKYWLCVCDCGNKDIISVLQGNLVGGYSKSCGCAAHETLKNNGYKRRPNKPKEIPYDDSLTFALIKKYGEDALELYWDYELNKLDPYKISWKNNKIKIWMKCVDVKYHPSYETTPKIAIHGGGCLWCHSFASHMVHPLDSFAQFNINKLGEDFLNKYWDWDKNNKLNIDPWELSPKSKKKVWLICQKVEYHQSYLTNPCDFSNGCRCIYCSNAKTHPKDSFAQWGIDNLGADFLDKYWDEDKNKELGIDPWMIKPRSDKKVWIKCQEKDYHQSYEVTCNSFSGNNRRCPYCCNKKIHPLDSLGQVLKNSKLLALWSDKNNETVYKYAPLSNKKVWWRCGESKHEDFERTISLSNACNFRCPQCMQERKESLLQEKVRLYLENLGGCQYTVLHERNCTIVPINPKTKSGLPFDNEVKELKLIIEVNGKQHYEELSGIWFDKHFDLHKRKIYDRYKRMYAKSLGYEYLEIPCWTDDKGETWKRLIDDKIIIILETNKQ